MKWGRSRGVRDERTEHTQLFCRTLAGSGLTGHQKVHFSTFDGKLESQCRNEPQNLPFCPGSLQNTFMHFLRKYINSCLSSFFLSNIWTSGNLKVWKRRAPENNRDLSSQKCFNFRGVLIGDKTDCKTDAWELGFLLGNFGTGTFAPGSQAWGTGLLRLGEPADGHWWNPGAPSPLPGL